MSFDQIAWFPLCAGLTAVGLVLGFLAFRRRGAAAGLRVSAWSLIPIAAYLTGALPAAWKIGTAVVGFFTGLVFSPAVWAGVAVAGLSVVLFLVSGVLRRRRGDAAAPAREARTAKQAAPRADQGAAAPTTPNRTLPQKPAASADDDLSDIEEILKRRGIS
ncbi:cellulose synthase [Sphaerisporangium sp. NPDC049002]|uniref:cellulose synthase n=1 Tax=unclassified Sphaerisporangium TaxID=2630420 RepID=UPI0033DE5F2C